MTVSRRLFLRTGVFTAAALASAPVQAFAVGRIPPGDGPLIRNRGGNRTPDPGSTQPGQSPAEQYAGLSKLSHNAFQNAVGTPFEVSPMSAQARPFWVRLTSVKDFATATPANPASLAVSPRAQFVPATVSFNLAFSGGPVKNVAAGTFLFQHAELGQFAMFITPAGPQQYSAVINWLQTGKAIPV